jgi:hypothetical protein
MYCLFVLLMKKPTQVCPDIANGSGGGPEGKSTGKKVTQMLHERHPVVTPRDREPATSGTTKGPENGVALTAGGAMRAEDDRRVRQKQPNPFSRSLSPFWGTKVKIVETMGDSGPLE